MGDAISFRIEHRSSVCEGRTGLIETPHGSFQTPAFMPVGTRGSVKGILPPQIRESGAECVLNNTYHLMLRPGSGLIQRRGGVHRFMSWDGPILTDSGGYQAYSMADINAIDEDGVTFKSVLSGEKIRLTPEISMRVQNELGPDIMMAFDDCPPSVDPDLGPTNQTRIRLAAERDSGGRGRRRGYSHEGRLDLALERTTRWLERCKAAHANPETQALFGIVQGGTDLERRSRSVAEVCGIELPGYAIGGVAVGETGEDIKRVVRHTAPLMPADKPRYLMGVGYPRDIVAAVCAGVDMFDCVLPTRNGRNANAFVRDLDESDGRGQLRLRNAKFAEDDRPLEADCDCQACDPGRYGWPTVDGAPFSRAYIRHLFQVEEMLGPVLVSLHNLRFYQRLMIDVRSAVANDDWPGLACRWPGAADGIPPGLLAGGLA